MSEQADRLRCRVQGLLTSMPSSTSPNTQWRPSSHGVSTVLQERGKLQEEPPTLLLAVVEATERAHVMKNWEPFVFGPALAMLRRPGLSCFNWKFSSANVLHRTYRDTVATCFAAAALHLSRHSSPGCAGGGLERQEAWSTVNCQVPHRP